MVTNFWLKEKKMSHGHIGLDARNNFVDIMRSEITLFQILLWPKKFNFLRISTLVFRKGLYSVIPFTFSFSFNPKSASKTFKVLQHFKSLPYLHSSGSVKDDSSFLLQQLMPTALVVAHANLNHLYQGLRCSSSLDL